MLRAVKNIAVKGADWILKLTRKEKKETQISNGINGPVIRNAQNANIRYLSKDITVVTT